MRLGQQLYDSIFPPKFELMPRERQLLAQMYPRINWSRVVVHHQMPWFMRYSFAIGVALPDAYNRCQVHIHIRQLDCLAPAERWAILVHEAFHVQQYYDLGSLEPHGWSWGYQRRFMRYYLGWYFHSLWKGLFQERLPWRKAQRQAYRQHPMEVPAYWQEGLFRKQSTLFQARAVNDFFKETPHLICTHSRIPQAPPLFFHGIAWFLCGLIALSKPFLDVLLYPLSIALGGRSKKKHK